MRRYFSADEKLKMIELVKNQGVPVADVCRRFGIARKTFYGWLKRYKGQGGEGKKLRARYASGGEHWKSLDAKLEKKVVNLAVKNPQYSVRKIAGILPTISNTGVQRVLERNGLSTRGKRKIFAQQVKNGAVEYPLPLTTKIHFLLRELPVFPHIFDNQGVRRWGISAFSTVLLILLGGICSVGVYEGIKMVLETPGMSLLGLMFASVSLAIGSFFFLYSFKYYISLALVLSFSRRGQGLRERLGEMGKRGGVLGRLVRMGNPVLKMREGDGGKKGLMRWLFGAAKDKEEGELINGEIGSMELERKPFVSIHLPMYNEKRVARRVIEACAKMEYLDENGLPNFEVLVCDDSTDETTVIVEEIAERLNSEIRDQRLKLQFKSQKLKNLSGSALQTSTLEFIRILHRPSREGFKGGALRYALERTDPHTEFIMVFDADFVPFPDTIEQFMKHFQFVSKGLSRTKIRKSKVAAVTGYQWHVLNKDENWITKGIRTEYSGSYLIERPARELSGALKIIHGSVYMIRKNALAEVGWGTSITEDFELTLKLYEKGYKVVFTPYVQAPAECVSTLKRLFRQRMRWAEGHSNNVKKMFGRLIRSPRLSLIEKLELLYLSPYYLQAALFLTGNISWLIAELVFRVKLPFWTSLWGWSLVLTNMLALPLMNMVGLFVEESEKKDYAGLLSFIALCYLVVPFQAYAAVKGFLEREEGTWFRTPKTGRVTISLVKSQFSRLIKIFFPLGNNKGLAKKPSFENSTRTLALLNPGRSALDWFGTVSGQVNKTYKPLRMVGRAVLACVLLISTLLFNFAPMIDVRVLPVRAEGAIGLSSEKSSNQSNAQAHELNESKPQIILTDNRERGSTNDRQVATENAESKLKVEEHTPENSPEEFYLTVDQILKVRSERYEMRALRELQSLEGREKLRGSEVVNVDVEELRERIEQGALGQIHEMNGKEFLSYYWTKVKEGEQGEAYLIFLRSEAGVQVYVMETQSMTIALLEYGEGANKFDLKVQTRPVYQYRATPYEGEARWNNYTELLPVDIKVKEKEGTAIFTQVYKLVSAGQTPVVVGETELKVGWENGEQLSKLTFRLRENENVNRVLWENRILDGSRCSAGEEVGAEEVLPPTLLEPRPTPLNEGTLPPLNVIPTLETLTLCHTGEEEGVGVQETGLRPSLTPMTSITPTMVPVDNDRIQQNGAITISPALVGNQEMQGEEESTGLSDIWHIIVGTALWLYRAIGGSIKGMVSIVIALFSKLRSSLLTRINVVNAKSIGRPVPVLGEKQGESLLCGNIVIDWSDFKSGREKDQIRDVSLKTGPSETPVVVFYPSGVSGALEVDPALSTTVSSTQIVVTQPGRAKWTIQSDGADILEDLRIPDTDGTNIANAVMAPKETFGEVCLEDVVTDTRRCKDDVDSGTRGSDWDVYIQEVSNGRVVIHSWWDFEYADGANLEGVMVETDWVFTPYSLTQYHYAYTSTDQFENFGSRNAVDDFGADMEYKIAGSSWINVVVDDSTPDMDIDDTYTNFRDNGASSTKWIGLVNDIEEEDFQQAYGGYSDYYARTWIPRLQLDGTARTDAKAYFVWLADDADPDSDLAVIDTDYRNPDDLTDGLSIGSAWEDSDENTSSGDFFNEAEGVYNLQANGRSAKWEIDGGTYTRYKPAFKIRKWRKTTGPETVRLNDSALTSGTDYNVDHKPFSEAWYYDYNAGTSAYTKLADGGDTADADEYLGDTATNYTFSDNFDESGSSGDLFYLGSDDKFAGANVLMNTLGAFASGSPAWLTWQYCSANTDENTACDTWSSLTDLKSSDSKLVQSLMANGNFYFTPPSDWKKAAVNTGRSLYYIRAYNTGVAFTTSPIEAKITTDILLFQYLSDISSDDATFEIDPATHPQLKRHYLDDPYLEGFWRMESDGSTGETDLSPNGNNLTVSSGDTIPASTDEKEGTNSRDFERDDADYLYISDANQSELELVSNFTISGWFNFETLTSSANFVAASKLANPGASQTGWRFGAYGSYIRFTSDTTHYTTGSSFVSTGTWYHLAITHDGSTLRIYRDGSEQTGGDYPVSTSTFPTDNAVDFYIGAITGATSPFDGLLDEVAIFSRALSATEIKEIYEGGIASHSVEVDNKYKVVLDKDDSDDYLVIYDKSVDNDDPPRVFEFQGPMIEDDGTNNEYSLRDDDDRTTNVLVSSDTQVKIQVSGKYDDEDADAFLQDEGTNDDLTATETYTFDVNGFYVNTETDFQDDGLDLDNGDNDDGYRWMSVEFDGESTGEEHLESIYYGNGTTESSLAADGAFSSSQTYAVVQGASSYQDAIIGIAQTGWLNVQDGDTINDRSWYYDVDISTNTDRLWTRQQNTRPGGSRNAQWFFQLHAQADLDTEAAREAVVNDQKNPDNLSDGLSVGSEYKHYIQTKTFQPGSDEGKDTGLNAAQPSRSYGTTTTFRSSTTGNDKALLEMDLSAVPSQATCDSSTLTLTHTGAETGEVYTDVYEFLSANSDWTEGTSESPATAGQSTWDHRHDYNGSGDVNWVGSTGASTSGTDYNGTSIRTSGSSTDPVAGTKMDLTLSAAAVEDWFGASNENYGILLFGGSGGGGSVEYYSSDYTTNDTYRPKLGVNYSTTFSPIEGGYGIDAASSTTYDKASMVQFDLDGGSYTRYKPVFKIRKWRDTDLPVAVSLEGTSLYPGDNVYNNEQYNASLKPFSEAWYEDGGSSTQIADGGDTNSSDEYLNDVSNTYTLTGFSASDTIYLGSDDQFTGVNYILSTQANDGGATIDWEYWNGSAWTDLSGDASEVLGSETFETTSGSFYFTEPSDWTKYTLTTTELGGTTTGERALYWIRGTPSGTYTTAPVIERAWTDILLFQYLGDISSDDQTFVISSPAIRQSGGSIQIDVPNRYRAVMQTGDTDDFILIYDRYQNDSSPNPTHEFKGPCILETNTYCLRDDADRRTTIIESSDVRVKIRVEGKFNNEASTDYLDDDGGDDDLEVIVDYTFTTEGIFVENMTDFKDGLVLDAEGTPPEYNGYSWLQVYADVTDAAYDDTGNIIYGDGETEGTTSTDGAEFEDSNKYVVLDNASDYQDAFIGIQRAGWFDDTAASGIDEWQWDEGESGTQDLLVAQEQNGTNATSGKRYAKWFFLMLAPEEFDTEAEREAYLNDFRNPDILEFTTGSEWDDVPASPGLEFVKDNDQYVNFGSAAELDDLTALTYEAWVYWNGDTVATKCIYEKSSIRKSLCLQNGGDTIRGLIDYDTTDAVSDVDNFPSKQWVHVAMTWSTSDNTVRIYINGTEATYLSQTAGVGSVVSEASNNLMLSDGTGGWDGKIDEFRVWNDVRTAAEIRENMFKQLNGDEANLLGYWRLDENTGTTVYDRTSNANNGTFGGATGTPTWTTGFVPDHYNEAEGIYTVDASGDQVELDIDGGSNVSTLLNGAVTAGSTSITVDSATGFPSSGIAYINGDKFSYTGTTATTFTGIPSTGELSVIGHADNTVVSLMNRHKPMFKIRGYRLNDKPSLVTMEGTTLTEGTDYNLDYKPISDAYFADELLWYSTMESVSAWTSPDIGDGTNSGSTNVNYVTGKYGNGAEFDSTTDYLNYDLSTGNFDYAKGAIEFWYKPSYDKNDNTEHNLFRLVESNDAMFLQKQSDNDLLYRIILDLTNIDYVISSANFDWSANEWVHIRVEWNEDEPVATQQRVLINGVEPSHTDDPENDDYDSSTFSADTNAYVGNFDSSDDDARGIIDELRIYGGASTEPDDLAQGGDTADSNEYLFSEDRDYTLDFEPVDSNNRGEYLFIGSDSMFSGVNVDLETNGATGGTLNLDWEYWDGDSWADLESISGFTDGTSNLTQDGAVYWSVNPTNWRPYSVNGSTDLYYIRGSLNNASGTYTTSPVENLIRTDILILQYLSSVTSTDQTLVVVPERLWLLLTVIPFLPGLLRKRKELATRLDSINRISSSTGDMQRLV